MIVSFGETQKLTIIKLSINQKTTLTEFYYATGQPRYLKVKYFELSKVRHNQNVMSLQYDVHVKFLKDILLQYMCSKAVPTDKQIEMKTKEIHFSFFYFYLNYIVDHHNATALARDKQYCIAETVFFF